MSELHAAASRNAMATTKCRPIRIIASSSLGATLRILAVNAGYLKRSRAAVLEICVKSWFYDLTWGVPRRKTVMGEGLVLILDSAKQFPDLPALLGNAGLQVRRLDSAESLLEIEGPVQRLVWVYSPKDAQVVETVGALLDAPPELAVLNWDESNGSLDQVKAVWKAQVQVFTALSAELILSVLGLDEDEVLVLEEEAVVLEEEEAPPLPPPLPVSEPPLVEAVAVEAPVVEAPPAAEVEAPGGDRLRRENMRLSGQVEVLKKRIEEALEKNKELARQLKSLERGDLELRLKDNERLLSENRRLKERLSVLEQRNEGAEQNRNTLAQELAELRKQKAELREELAAIQAENQRLDSSAKEAARQLETLEELRHRAGELSKLNRQLTAEDEAMRLEQQDLRLRLHEAKTRNEELAAELEVARAAAVEGSVQGERLGLELADRAEVIVRLKHTLEKTVTEAQKVLHEELERSESLQEQLAGATTLAQAKEQALASLEQQHAAVLKEKLGLDVELEAQRQAAREATKSAAELQEAFDELRGRSLVTGEELERLRAAWQEDEEKIERLSAEVKAQESAGAELQNAREEISGLRALLVQKSLDVDGATSMRDAAAKERRELEAAALEAKEALAQVQASLAARDKELAATRKELAAKKDSESRIEESLLATDAALEEARKALADKTKEYNTQVELLKLESEVLRNALRQVQVQGEAKATDAVEGDMQEPRKQEMRETITKLEERIAELEVELEAATAGQSAAPELGATVAALEAEKQVLQAAQKEAADKAEALLKGMEDRLNYFRNEYARNLELLEEKDQRIDLLERSRSTQAVPGPEAAEEKQRLVAQLGDAEKRGREIQARLAESDRDRKALVDTVERLSSDVERLRRQAKEQEESKAGENTFAAEELQIMEERMQELEKERGKTQALVAESRKQIEIERQLFLEVEENYRSTIMDLNNEKEDALIRLSELEERVKRSQVVIEVLQKNLQNLLSLAKAARETQTEVNNILVAVMQDQ